MEPASHDGMPGDVLIVEDDPIIALDFEDTILGFGVKTVRTAGNVARALELIADRAPDFALLDVGAGARKKFCGCRAAGRPENSVRLRHRLWHRGQASAGFRGQAEVAKAVFERRAASGAETPRRRRRSRIELTLIFGSSVVDHSATSARSRKVTVIWPVAPSILT